MPTNKLTADAVVSKIDKDNSSSREKAIKLSEERANKIRLDLYKKYKGDEEKIAVEYAKKVATIEQGLNKLTSEEKKKLAQEEYADAVNALDKLKAYGNQVSVGVADAASKAISSTISSVNSGINEYLGVYSQYMSGIETRLLGSEKSFSSITDMISSNIGASTVVSQQDVLQNLSKLVEAGIVYNVEQRAFLETVSDRIVTTFDSFDASLLRIIRIQQADSTVARMGLEAELTSFFNNTFGDTSYLNNLYDSVTASLLAASSTMGTSSAVEFEYVVQKWLGSLSSVGVSDSTIQQIAAGIGYLGSGNISSLSSDTDLQNLLVMASSKAGLDYGSLLTGGLTAENANALLKSIVEFSQEMAASDNRVVLSQYASIFGMDITDLMALSNVTSDNLLEISKNLLSYAEMESVTTSLISTIGDRMTLQDKIDTMFDNVMGNIGEGIANSAALYATWVVADLVEQATGGISIPSFTVLGTGTDLNTTVAGLIKTGIVGMSTLSNIGTILAGLSGTSNLSLDNWGAEDVRTSGTGFTSLVTTGISSTTSQTSFVGSTSTSDIYEGSVGATQDEAGETISGKAADADELVAIIKNNIATDLNSILKLLESGSLTVKIDAMSSFLAGQDI